MTDNTIFNRHDAETLYFVAIEWDGVAVSSTWYERLHALAGRVRGDKSQTPVVRRDDESGVIFQEGLIFTPSESLARTLAFLARDEMEPPAAAVAIGEAVVKTRFTMSREDAAVIDRISRTLGKRGRKPKPQNWVVTCIEELRPFEIEHSDPIQCPHCRGTRIRKRPGKTTIFRDDGDDIFKLWARSRFSGPHWEPADVEIDGSEIPPAFDEIEIGSNLDLEIVSALKNSDIMDQIIGLTRSQQIDILDAVFVARRFNNSANRQTARINAIAKYFQDGGTRSDFAMAETPIPDLLDVATVMGVDRAAFLWSGVMKN